MAQLPSRFPVPKIRAEERQVGWTVLRHGPDDVLARSWVCAEHGQKLGSREDTWVDWSVRKAGCTGCQKCATELLVPLLSSYFSAGWVGRRRVAGFPSLCLSRVSSGLQPNKYLSFDHLRSAMLTKSHLKHETTNCYCPLLRYYCSI